MEKSRKGHTEDSEVGTVSCTVPPLKTGTLQQKQQQSRWPLPNLAPNTSHLEQRHGFAPCKGKKSTTSFRKLQPSHALPKTSTKFTNLFSQMNLPCQSPGWEAEREREKTSCRARRDILSPWGMQHFPGLLFIRTASLLPEKPWSRKSGTVRSLPVGNCICEKEASHSCLTAHWHVNTAWFPAPDTGVCDADSSAHKHLNLVVSKETRGLIQFTLHCFAFKPYFHFAKVLPFPKTLPYSCLSCICIWWNAPRFQHAISTIEMGLQIWPFGDIDLSLMILRWLNQGCLHWWLNQGCLYLTFINLSLIFLMIVYPLK